MVRTRSGCWTCRLQTKKKCDETKPECKRCTGLGIHCFGYGPRPRNDELGGDRRALIAPVGANSRTEDSAFRVWRFKPALRTAGLATRPNAYARPKERESNIRQPSGEIPTGRSSFSGSLVALDRINSGMLDFLHPQLLTNYTDHVFWLDSRFYQSPGSYSGNSWLGNYLVRSKETRLAAALMGLTWQTLQADISRLINIDFTQPLMVLHSAVVQGVKDEIQRSRTLLSNEEVPTVGANLAHCASLLLVFEVWRTLEGDWIPHLRGMADILRWIKSRAPTTLDVASKMKVEEQKQEHEFVSMKAAPTPDGITTSLALKWFVQSYTWNDITAAVWIGPCYTDSRLYNFYMPLLEEGYLQLDKFMGCEDWVLLAFAQISRLEKSLLSDTASSTINGLEIGEDAIREAAELERRLNRGLGKTLIQRLEHSPGPERDTTFVTEMWIHAALVYLHVVAVGARFNHPQLRRYVTRGLRAYLELPRRLDIHTAMPFGVLASMAGENEAQDAWRIAVSSRSFEEINPGQRKTFTVVKECWRMRACVSEAGPTDKAIDWRHGAKSLGVCILPV